MRERFELLSPNAGRRVTFGTFHAVFFQILKNAYRYTVDQILHDDRKYRILQDCADRLKLQFEDEKELLGNLAAEISMVKNEQIPLEHFYSGSCGEEAFRAIYRCYQETLERNRLIDFDDMLVYCHDLFSQRTDILALWQRRFRYILIDEFQDINSLQYAIVRMLALPENNLFVVGDDDQSIYRFRGAKPEIMLNFQKDYPDAQVVILEENYRSANEIVEASQLVIRENKKRFQKQIRSARTVTGAGPLSYPGTGRKRVHIQCFKNQDHQAAYLIRCIQNASEEGRSYEEMAILTRTNAGARYIAEKLMEYQIPFRMKERLPNIYDHWIAKDLFAYLRMANGSIDRRDFLQVMNRPVRYLSRECLDTPEVSLERLRTWYEDKPWMVQRIDRLEEELALLGRMKPFAAVNYIRFGMEYQEYLKSYAQDHRLKEEELTEILNQLQESAASFQNLSDWFAHIDDYRRKLEELHQLQNGSRGMKQKDEAVTLATLHGAKGLEFQEVYMIDLNEDTIPHRKSVHDADIEEERRLFYVGMTRAKETLHLYYVKERYGKKQDPSRFLEVFDLDS